MAKLNRFENVIGQPEAKDILSFHLNAYENSRPHIMEYLVFGGAKGDGKTLIAKETAKQLVAYGDDGKPVMREDGKPKKKTWIELGAPSISSGNSFINFLISNVCGRDVTLFIDEAHNIPAKAQEVLLSLTNPNPTNRNTYNHDGVPVEIDFAHQTMFFATSESHKLKGPLLNRFERIDVRPYTLEELGEIVKISVPEIQYKDGVIENVASVVRGNGRSAMKFANRIKKYLCGKHEFSMKDWNKLVKVFRIRPLGLSQLEINLLHHMAERPQGSSLTSLAARTGLSRDAVMKDYESYLMGKGLMEVAQGKGRVLTGKGQQYLNDLPKYDAQMGIA